MNDEYNLRFEFEYCRVLMVQSSQQQEKQSRTKGETDEDELQINIVSREEKFLPCSPEREKYVV